MAARGPNLARRPYLFGPLSTPIYSNIHRGDHLAIRNCLWLFVAHKKKYSLNVKRVKWLLFKRVKSVRTTLTEWKSLSKRVKSFQSEWKSLRREWESLQKSDFHFLAELTEGQLETKELSLSELPKKVKVTLLEWFSLSSEWFSLALEWFSLVLRVIFTRLEWSLRFSLFWRVTISLFLHEESN